MALTIACGWLSYLASTPGTLHDFTDPVWLTYVNPVARLFEFTLGMCVGLLSTRVDLRLPLTVSSALEGGALTLVLFWGALIPAACSPVSSLATMAAKCGGHMGFALCGAVLILLLSSERGLLSRALKAPFLVLLGEISYSMYLIHWLILIQILWMPSTTLQQLPLAVVIATYWTMLLLISHLSWKFIEMPCRRYIVQLGTNRERIPLWQWYKNTFKALGTSKASLFVAAEVLIICGTIAVFFIPDATRFMHGHIELSAIGNDRVEGIQDVRFANQFMLRAISLTDEGDYLSAKLLWKSLKKQPLTRKVAVHFLDATGKIKKQRDYVQDSAQRTVRQGTEWIDTVTIAKPKLVGIHALAFAIYDPSLQEPLLPIDRGPRDWGNCRLIVPLNNSLAQRSTRAD